MSVFPCCVFMCSQASVEAAIIAVVHNMPREAVPILLELLRSVQGVWLCFIPILPFSFPFR